MYPNVAPETLLYCAPVSFDSIKQRPHWLALALSRWFRVLYLDPHRSLLSVAPRLGHTRPHGPSMAVVTPPTLLPLSGIYRRATRWNSSVLAHVVRRACKTLGWSLPERAVVTFPKQLDLVRAALHLPFCYDVMDDYPSFFRGRERTTLRAMHEETLRAAAAVVVSSRGLAAMSGRADATLVENGVPAEFIEACRRGPADVLRIRNLPPPRLGYVGAIAPWIDMDLIVALARSFPEGTVVLAGPVHCRLPPLPPNVVLLGEIPHAAVGSVMCALDLGLVPFKRADWLDAVNPVKVYEYLAAGLPVLATDSPELRRFAPAVVTCPRDAWCESARQLLTQAPKRDAQRAVVAGATWDARAQAFYDVLQRVC